ncbi:helix-turn-helix transcriptional regulator [Candidatus Poribacteria bacterium]|nr:helix-turn-helix transcriptional regulator [Candidatus Poribacteria bacterium]
MKGIVIMLGDCLIRFRLGRGLSLVDLETAIDGLVSSQTLSKYERGELQPTARDLNRIASAFGIKSVQLWGEPTCDTEAEPLLNQTMDLSTDKPLSERRRFLQLPKEKRDRILSEQAKEMADFYENDTEWQEWLAGPILDYDIP